MKEESEHYNERVWLNDEDSPSTGSIVCYQGPANWCREEDPDQRDEIFFVEVADCHCKARLHAARYESMDSYREKVRKMRDCLNRYLEHLETIERKK